MKIKRNKIDKAFSDAKREAANWTCECCGKYSPPEIDNGQMDNAHNVSRRYKLLRYDPRNTACLCRACHMKMTDDPDTHVTFFRQLKGEDYNNMRDLMNCSTKLYKADEESIFQHYKNELNEMKVLRQNDITGTYELRIPDVLL